MNMIFLTAFVAIFAVTNGLLVQPRQNSMDVELEDSALCTVCELVVNKAVELLNDGDTEAEIEKVVKKVCKILPGKVETECESLVDKYGDEIIKMLADSVDPQTICGLLKLCSSDGVPARKEMEKQKPKNVELEDSALCTVCELVVNKAVELLNDGDTEAEIEKIVKKVCKILPGKVETECESLVDKYGDEIIKMLADSVDPQTICGLLKLCSSDGVSVRKEMEKQKPTHAVKNISQCLLCELIVDEGKKLLENGATKSEIEKGIKKVCNEQQPEPVKTACNKLVGEYGDKIIPMLTESAQAVKVCGTFKLC